MPTVSLMINEFQLGTGPQPRWIEIYNPSPVTLDLKGTVLRISNKTIGTDGSIEFAIGAKVPKLPAGEVLLLGHIPQQAGDLPFYALQLVDLSGGFELPACETKVDLFGAQGLIDSHKWDMCSGGVPKKEAWQAVVSLDPDYTDLCQSDNAGYWCTTTTKDSPAKPTPGKLNQFCDLDGDGYTKNTGDCDDQNSQIHPLATEICNGVDDNCSGQSDEDVVAPAGTCLVDGVCGGATSDGSPVAQCAGKKGFVCKYPPGFQSVSETLCDGFDNDCDGQTDEGLLNACGACGALPDELCNGVDDDCDGETDEEPVFESLSCGGLGVCALATPECGLDGEPVCALPLTYQATETLCDAQDNDCDGLTDEELGLGQACVIGQGVCAGVGVVSCSANGDVRCQGQVSEPQTETCGDNLDNDCDGQTDEGFDLGSQCTVGLGVCRVTGKRVCATESESEGQAVCDAVPRQAQGAERCGNQLDDDCDGMTDEPGCKQPSSSDGCTAFDGRPSRPMTPHLVLIALMLMVIVQRRSWI